MKFYENNMIIKLNIDGFKFPFYLSNSYKDKMLLQEMINYCGFTIINQEERTIISEYDLKVL